MYIQFLNGTVLPITFDEWFPADRHRFLESTAPQKDSQIVRPIAPSTTVKIEECQRSTFLKYKELEIKMELGDTEKVGDREAKILIMTSKSGTPMKFFLDPETMMAMKMVATVNVPQLGGDIVQTTEFSDYREVDGVKIPFEVKITNTAQSITIKFSKVEHNKDIDDSMFSKPVEK